MLRTGNKNAILHHDRTSITYTRVAHPVRMAVAAAVAVDLATLAADHSDYALVYSPLRRPFVAVRPADT